MCFLFPTTFKKLSYPLNFLGLVYIVQYNVLINFSSLGMEVLITMNSWKTPGFHTFFQKNSPLHLFLKILLFYFAPLFCILTKRLFSVWH